MLLHGFGAALDCWDDITSDLVSDHRVIRIDLIGHGGTEGPRSGDPIQRQAALVSAILDNLRVNWATVIGHSRGGEVATALAELKPERIQRLIFIDVPPTVGNTFSILADAYFDPVIGELLSHFHSDETVRSGLAQGFAPGFRVPENFVADIRQLTYTAFREAHEGSIAYRRAKARTSGLQRSHQSPAPRHHRRARRNRASRAFAIFQAGAGQQGRDRRGCWSIRRWSKNRRRLLS